MPGAQAASLSDRPGVSLHYDFDSIELRDGAIDTRADQPDVPADLREVAGRGPQFWMVQFAGPIKAEWLKQLQEAGLEVVIYMPNNAYVVWGTAPAEKLTLLAAGNSMIQWSGAYHPAYRLSPSLREISCQAGHGQDGRCDSPVLHHGGYARFAQQPAQTRRRGLQVAGADSGLHQYLAASPGEPADRDCQLVRRVQRRTLGGASTT